MKKSILLLILALVWAGCASSDNIYNTKQDAKTIAENRLLHKSPGNNLLSIDSQKSYTLPPQQWWIVVRQKQLAAGLFIGKQPVQLKQANVRISIREIFAQTQLSLKFAALPKTGTASFLYPLPDDAAVNDFVMTIGKRQIRAMIMPKEQAQNIYNAALAQGHKAQMISQSQFDQMLIETAARKNEEIHIDFSYNSILRRNRQRFLYSLPKLNQAQSSKVNLELDIKTSTDILAFNCSASDVSAKGKAFKLNQQNSLCLAAGMKLSFDLKQSEATYVAKGSRGYIYWNSHKEILASSFNNAAKLPRKVTVNRQWLQAAIAHNEICKKLRQGASMNEITALAQRYKLLTPYTSFLAVDAMK